MRKFECDQCNTVLTKSNHNTGRIYECNKCDIKYVLVITEEKKIEVLRIIKSEKEAISEIEKSVISELYKEVSSKTQELRKKVYSRRAKWSHRVILGISALSTIPFIVIFFTPTIPKEVVLHVGIKTVEILYLFGMVFVYEHQKQTDIENQFAFYYLKKRKLGVMLQQEYLDILAHDRSLPEAR